MLKASWLARVAAFVVRRRVKPALADMRNIAAIVGGLAGEWVDAERPTVGEGLEAERSDRPEAIDVLIVGLLALIQAGAAAYLSRSDSCTSPH